MRLITLLPLLLLQFFINQLTLFLVSGYPKLNFFRKFFWKLSSNKIFKVTCPSIDLIHQLNVRIFFLKKNYIFYLIQFWI